MHILVDTNILIDYSFKKEYAINFFQEAKENYYDIYILEDVYAETKNLAPNFAVVKQLLDEFERMGTYHRMRTNKKLNKKTEDLTKKCHVLIGYDLDRTDRKLIVVALRHNLYILTKDKDLLQIAKTERCKLLAL